MIVDIEKSMLDATLKSQANGAVKKLLAEKRADFLFNPEPPADDPFAVQTGGDHYAKLAIGPTEYALANGIPYAEGSMIKYVTRWRDKGGVEDLKKARHMLDMLIAHEEAKP